jgi:hypothetical protein
VRTWRALFAEADTAGRMCARTLYDADRWADPAAALREANRWAIAHHVLTQLACAAAEAHQ